MKAFFVTLISIASGLALAGTHAVQAVVSGKVVGNGTTYETATAKGSEHKLVMTVNSPSGGSTSVTQVSYTDSLGRPTKASIEIKAGAQGLTAIAIFTGRSAKFTMTSQGKSKSITKVAPADLPIADPSNFWFKTIQPKIGKAIAIYTFDIQQGEWEKTSIVYKGDKDIKIGSSNIKCHEVVQTIKSGDVKYSQTIYLDQSGDTVRFIGPSLTVERKS